MEMIDDLPNYEINHNAPQYFIGNENPAWNDQNRSEVIGVQ